MEDTPRKDNIDLDELLNSILQKRNGTTADAPKESPPKSSRSTEGQGMSPADFFAAMLAEGSEEQEEAEVVEPVEAIYRPSDFIREDEDGNVTPSELADEEETEEALPEEPSQPVKKVPREKKSWFTRRRKQEETPEEWESWGLKPIGHYRVNEQDREPEAVLVEEIVAHNPTPEETAVETAEEPLEENEGGYGVDEFPAVQPVDETITMTIQIPTVAEEQPIDATRVIDTKAQTESEAALPVAQEPVVPEQLPDQLSMEEMVRVEDMEEQPEGVDEDPDQRLKRTRLEKIREFTINGEEEEENEPEEEVPEQEEETEIDDFHSYADTKAVQHELRYRCRTAALSMLVTGVLELVLLVLMLLTALMEGGPIMRMGYLTVQLFGLGLMLVLNYGWVGHGLSGLFRLNANGDSGPSLAAVVALLGIIPYFTDAATAQALPMWAPIAGLLMVFNATAHYIEALRVMRGFAFVAYPDAKYVASQVEDEKVLHEIGRRAALEGDTSVAYFRKTNFLSGYLNSAYEEDNSTDWARWMTPTALGVTVLLPVILLLAGQLEGFWSWLTVMVGMACVTMPALSLSVSLAVSRCCRQMMARGGFMVGWQAVRRFSRPDALAVDVADLYPDESMLLHGLKTFSGTHIDDAILDAASLSVRCGGPLSLIFRRIIENKEELLHEVDSLVYEQGMGVSGWVDGRRVLVGNRRLLENHGVDVPSTDYEARYAKNGRRLVYLSTGGELSAMFVVSYLPDPTIASSLQRLCRSRVMLLIRSCDQNITAESLCEDFDLPEMDVDVLPAVAGRLYSQLTEGESESAPAELASNGHILGTTQALSACRHVYVQSIIALAVQTALSALGLILTVVWAMASSPMLVLGIGLLTVASAVLSWLVPLCKRL